MPTERKDEEAPHRKQVNPNGVQTRNQMIQAIRDGILDHISLGRTGGRGDSLLLHWGKLFLVLCLKRHDKSKDSNITPAMSRISSTEQV